MTPWAGPRPSRGALMLVSISQSETVQWGEDPDFRTKTVADFAKLARQRGRRFLEIRDVRGTRLVLTEVMT